jgi:hypothetical protein
MYTLSPPSFVPRHMFSFDPHRIFTNPLYPRLSPFLHVPHPPLSQNEGSTALIGAAFMGKPRIVDILIKADPSGDHLNIKVE